MTSDELRTEIHRSSTIYSIMNIRYFYFFRDVWYHSHFRFRFAKLSQTKEKIRSPKNKISKLKLKIISIILTREEQKYDKEINKDNQNIVEYETILRFQGIEENFL